MARGSRPGNELGNTRYHRLRGAVSVPISGDSHVTILAVGRDALQVIRPGAPALAMSNPIFVDVDDDGLSFPGPGPIDDLGLYFCSQ